MVLSHRTLGKSCFTFAALPSPSERAICLQCTLVLLQCDIRALFAQVPRLLLSLRLSFFFAIDATTLFDRKSLRLTSCLIDKQGLRLPLQGSRRTADGPRVELHFSIDDFRPVSPQESARTPSDRGFWQSHCQLVVMQCPCSNLVTSNFRPRRDDRGGTGFERANSGSSLCKPSIRISLQHSSKSAWRCTLSLNEEMPPMTMPWQAII